MLDKEIENAKNLDKAKKDGNSVKTSNTFDVLANEDNSSSPTEYKKTNLNPKRLGFQR